MRHGTSNKHDGPAIVVYGTGSGSGKTALVENLLRLLPGWAAVKLAPDSGVYSSVSLEDISSTPADKDTARMARAGGDPVLLVRAPRHDLPQALEQALSLLPPSRPVVIEGSAALTILRPALTILVWRPGAGPSKTPLEKLSASADLVFVNVEPRAAMTTGISGHLDKPFLRGCLAEPLTSAVTRDLESMLLERGLM